MAKPTLAEMKTAFTPHIPAGEVITHAAYGIKQPHILLIVLLMLAGILPGLIVVVVMTKHYLIGQSAAGVTVLQIKGMTNLAVRKAMRFSSQELAGAQVKTSSAGLFTNIKIIDGQRNFVAKFHKMYSRDNQVNAEAIAAFAAAA
ncbi:hypothetical protein [Hyphomonas johnsonii]|uniref:Uncharacterized protein n=1 Tax=Hyphomonas johnsonii MHS-2 TaxID=1280950 RepID=A0A059FQT6_9PROT|nr:hypothetical protein [Hyphomonas johnsonii]KCZ92833.1 hypothetical protein HJO_07757 [Hyphomonas johnsonii MHS-2]